ncbi:MAG: malonate transporter subunit MadL [Cyclobacteriaceae bacterium]|nr:malonate transporter subunit MadL [Cyclobacteriaceae bacterium]
MTIYGVAMLAACFLIGKLIGEGLGDLIGIDANIGGVGFAMILLIMGSQWLHQRRWLDTLTESGITFWSNMYIPVIVAMSATQNVKGALSGGMIALLAGTIPTALCFLMIPWLSRLQKRTTSEHVDKTEG